MKTFAEFRSTQFPPCDGEEEQVNPGLWGRRLAEYFVRTLPGHGLTVGEPVPEDWGWYLPVEVGGTRLALCCGHQYGDDDTFICFTEPSQPVSRRFLRKVDVTAELERLVGVVDAVLSSDPEIRDLSWREP